jgi:hypothetical protein
MRRIIVERCFSLNGEDYIARLYNPPNGNSIYGEVVYKETGERPRNMKGVVREYLRPHGIDISTDANVETTHSAVRQLIAFLDRNENAKKSNAC